MNIFITGGTGFIGCRVVRRLLQARNNLTCLVRHGRPVSDELNNPGVTLVNGDVTDKTSVLRGMEGCRWVIHLAGLYSFWESDNRRFHDINVLGTRNVMECSLERGVTKIVHVSTAGIFGKPADTPFTETSLPGPTRFGRYFKTKYEGDCIVWDLHRKKALPVVVVYPGAVLGASDPKTTGTYILNLIRRKLPATVFTESVLTCVHVDDVAEIIARAAEKEGNIGEKYLAGNERLSFGEINAIVSDISGVALPKLHLPDPLTMMNAYMLTGLSAIVKKPPPWGLSLDQVCAMREGFRFDGSKAERELGITYTPARTAIKEAIASYQA